MVNTQKVICNEIELKPQERNNQSMALLMENSIDKVLDGVSHNQNQVDITQDNQGLSQILGADSATPGIQTSPIEQNSLSKIEIYKQIEAKEPKLNMTNIKFNKSFNMNLIRTRKELLRKQKLEHSTQNLLN